jgi:hypothetical protein
LYFSMFCKKHHCNKQIPLSMMIILTRPPFSGHKQYLKMDGAILSTRNGGKR